MRRTIPIPTPANDDEAPLVEVYFKRERYEDFLDVLKRDPKSIAWKHYSIWGHDEVMLLVMIVAAVASLLGGLVVAWLGWGCKGVLP